MTTSQQEVRDTPICEDHGYMIPVDYEHVLLNDNGVVVAMVTWWDDGDDKPLSEVIYALDEESLAQVPRLAGDIHVGDWAYKMGQAGRLVPFVEIVRTHPGFLRIDDARPGHKHSYRVYGGEQLSDEPRLQPNAVYYCFIDDDTDDRRHPPCGRSTMSWD